VEKGDIGPKENQKPFARNVGKKGQTSWKRESSAKINWRKQSGPSWGYSKERTRRGQIKGDKEHREKAKEKNNTRG